MDKDIAIKVEYLSKTFRIPHEKISSVRGAVVSAFKQKTYEEFKALDDVSFEVKKGEFFGIIGRNGSGKSTLLKILAGIYQPDKGRVQVNGMISPFLELGIGFNPELSGRDNVYLNATVLGMTRKQIDEKFDDIVRFSELERFIDQKLKNYSSGMQVRLAFAVSIHANRDILLMDEVLAVGDANFQAKCLDEFVSYKKLGKTVLLVSHDISVIERYCDRALLLRNGKIVKIGYSQDVRSEYINENIFDEEERIKTVRPGQQDKVTKNSVSAEITEVDFFNINGDKKNVFKTREDILIRAFFKKKDSVRELNFGIAIYNREGMYVFGINTFIEGLDLREPQKKGFFELHLKTPPLKDGSYFVKVALYGSDINRVYSFVEKSKPFKLISESKSHGSVDIDYILS